MAVARIHVFGNVIRLTGRRPKVRRKCRLEIAHYFVKKSIMLCLAEFLFSTIYISSTQSQTSRPNAAPVVIANYRPDFAAYGSTVAGFKRDIQDAQAAGVDAFAVDVMGWGPGTAPWADYEQLSGPLFQAASELGTGFKLFFDLDCQNVGFDSACITAAGQMLAAYGNHPNYMKYQGRPMFTGWSMGLNSTKGSADDKFWSAVVASIRATRLNPFFIPTFSNWTAANPISPSRSYANTDTWFTTGWLNGVVQGLMAWGTYVPSLAIENNNAFAAVAAKHNIAFAAGVESWHAPIRLLSTRQIESAKIMASLEFNGGEGLSAIWKDIITNIKPRMVYLVTWNDYTESYVGPASQAYLAANNLPNWQVTGDYLFTHAAYAELNKYFIQWYKTGYQPIWPDAMYVFYRNASTKMAASAAPAGTVIGWNVQGLNPTLDDLYITTILTAPATLTVTTGTRVERVSLGSGMNHTRIPFAVGTQNFRLSRGQTTLINITGANVVPSQPHYYNVNPLAYHGYYKP